LNSLFLDKASKGHPKLILENSGAMTHPSAPLKRGIARGRRFLKASAPFSHLARFTLYLLKPTAMPPSNQKKLGQRPEKETVTLSDTLGDTWRVMKPFVRFSVKALKVVARGLVFIVRHIPRPEEHRPASKNTKIVKIK